jgi:hypothetical protein
MLARRDRDQLRSEIRQLLGVEAETSPMPSPAIRSLSHAELGSPRLAGAEKAGKGRGVHL